MCYGMGCRYENSIGDCVGGKYAKCPEEPEEEYDDEVEEIPPTEDEINDAANKQFDP